MKDKMQIRVAGLFGKNKLLMRIECPGSVWNNANTNTFANKNRNKMIMMMIMRIMMIMMKNCPLLKLQGASGSDNGD